MAQESQSRVPRVAADGEVEELGTTSVALFDFEGQREDMLTFKEGDIITIIEMNSNGWWKGACTNGKVGIFPYSYVEVKISNQDSFPFARAVYELPPSEDEEQLSFEQDEVITILKELNEDWSFGRRSNGDTGRFPRKYVELTGEYNEALFAKEMEKWEKIEQDKTKEEEKILEEKAALERKFLEEERDIKENNLKSELDKMKEEADKLRKENEKQLAELKKQKEEFMTMQRDLLIKQERARRELDVAKAEAASLRKLQERKDARKSTVIQTKLDGEVRRLQKRVRQVGDNFSNQAPGPPPTYTAEILDIDENPFGDDDAPVKKKKNKKLTPFVTTVYNSEQKSSKPELTKEEEAKVSKIVELEKKQEEAPKLPPLPATTEVTTNKKRNKVLKKFANLGKGSQCKTCGKSVGIANRVKACGTLYHDTCFKCATCDKIIRGGKYIDRNNHPYCHVCHARGFGPKGFGNSALGGTGKTGGEVKKAEDKPKGEVVKDSWV